MPPQLRALVARLALPALLVLALALRLFGLDWDNGALYHPDERAILMKVGGELRIPALSELPLLLDAKRSPLNPHWFAYGSFPLYLLKAAGELAGLVGPRFARQDLYLVGRALSALADTATVLLVYLLGRSLGGRTLGLLGAGLTALTVLHIQQSHFFVADVLLTTFVLLVLLLSVRAARQPSAQASAVAGLALGLALATKVSALPLLVPLGLAHLLPVLEGNRLQRGRLWPATAHFILSLLAAALAFAVAQPYALLDFPTFWGDVQEQRAMVLRVADFPYTRQYVDTLPYLYLLRELALWALGLPLGLAALGGAAYAVMTVVRRPRPADLLLLAWVAVLFGINGALPVKFLRYLLPIIPILVLWAARALLEGLGRWRWPRAIVLVLVVGGTSAYAFAYLGIYSRPHPAEAAVRWMRDHVPPGSSYLWEHWEEPLRGLVGYREQQLPLYEADTPEKLALLSQRLAEADYLIFYSHRLYGTIPRLPQLYPLTTAYYQLLFAGELGYELVHRETSFPRLGPIALADDTLSRPGLPVPSLLREQPPAPLTLNLGSADESFTVYDHPQVLIFRRIDPLTPLQLQERIRTAALTSQDSSSHRALLRAQDVALYAAAGTGRHLFPSASWTQRLPLLAWLLAVESMALVAWPLLYPLSQALPDRGFLLAKALGPVLVAYGVWMLASLRLLAFSPWSVLVWGTALAAVAGFVAVRRRQEIGAFLTHRWRLLLAGEVLFLFAFGAFVAIRMMNPDLWHPWRGGEKPMDFAFLNAILRSPYMPPADPWFSGGTINYYYWGHFLVATVIRLTGIEPGVAYNLAVPWLFALTVTGATVVASALIAVGRGHGALRSLGSGILAALFIAVLGNLDGALQLLESGRRLLQGLTPLPFDFWRSSRMLAPTTAITEFPFFTFLFADLHAHLIALPLTLLALGLMVALVGSAEGPRGRALTLLALLALVLGSLLASNTWDFPTYAALGLGAVALWAWRRGRGHGWRVLVEGMFAGLILMLLAYGAFWPFHLHYELAYGGLTASPERTPLLRYLAIYGLFLFLALSWLLVEARHEEKPSARAGLAPWTTPLWGWPILLALLFFPALLLLLQSHPLLPWLWPLLALILLLLGIRLRSFATEAWAPPFVLLLLVMALALSGAVELVTVRGDIGRMNTVFKLSLQIWVLLGLVGAYGTATLLEGLPWPRSSPRWAWLGAACLLVLASAIYPLAATPVRLADRFGPTPWTLNGRAYMAGAVYPDEHGPLELRWDAEAIRWFQEQVEGSPVIVEGVTPPYRWGGRYSVNTGLPAVAGWDWHERQQRPLVEALVRERQLAVATIYGTEDHSLALALLQRYRARYVIVGPLERLYYPASALAKFEGMPELRLVYENPGVRVYEVDSDQP